MQRSGKRAPELLIAAALLLAPVTQASNIYNFQTLDNNADPTFNQLLGVNDAGLIVGYFGSGATGHPNQGYTLASPYGQANYTNENFPGSTQTQVVGVNSLVNPTTVGFWVDGSGNNFGFVDQNGVFTSVSDPNVPAAGPTVTQLLGVNDNNMAAGFYVDAGGNAQGFLFNITTMTFTPITLPVAFSAAMTTASGVNNNGVVTGFYTDTAGNVHGFIDNAGTFTSYDDPSGNGTNTTFLGENNAGMVVGSYVDAAGVTHGLLFDPVANSWTTINDPNASSAPAFDVTGTTVNGINDQGQLAGFFSDGTNVNGFLASIPEPESLTLFGLGMLAIVVRRVLSSRSVRRG